MKKLLLTALLTLGMIGLTGCTSGADAQTNTKCAAGKCAAGKCGGDKAKFSSKKCATNGKCANAKMKMAEGKCKASGKCGK